MIWAEARKQSFEESEEGGERIVSPSPSPIEDETESIQADGLSVGRTAMGSQFPN